MAGLCLQLSNQARLLLQRAAFHRLDRVPGVAPPLLRLTL
jgi:hypothetical protein